MELRLAIVMILGKKMAVNELARKLICLLTFIIYEQTFVFLEAIHRRTIPLF